MTTRTDLKLATKLSLCGGRTLMSVREPALLPSERFSSVVSMSVQFSPLKPHSPGKIVSSTAGLVMRALLSRATYLSANNCRGRQL